MTLIELLITVTIIAILSAVFLGASRSAMESARAARTKTTITKIHGLLMERWASYATRRVDFDASTIVSSTPQNRGKLLARARLDALRRLMQIEMPDRWSDVLAANVASQLPNGGSATRPTIFLPDFNADNQNYYQNLKLPYPALSNFYLRRYNSMAIGNWAGSAAEKVERIEDNQGAECLYMIVMQATGDGEARTLFNQRDIGDTDGDGALEFLDGWGRPIHYLRWPAGFAEAELSSLMTHDADKDHDPFDYFRRDNPPDSFGPGENRGYRLVPLIYSGGPDGDPDLYTAKGPTNPPIADPYAEYEVPADNITAKIGTPMASNPLGINIDQSDDGDGWIDNIHNHLQDNR